MADNYLCPQEYSPNMIPILKHKHILVADDDIAIRDLIAYTMKQEGCGVTEENFIAVFAINADGLV